MEESADHLLDFKIGEPQLDFVRLPSVLGVHPRCDRSSSTSFMMGAISGMSGGAKGAALGGVAAGAGMYLFCKTKCPNGSKSGMLGQAGKELMGGMKGLAGGVGDIFSGKLMSGNDEAKVYGQNEDGEMIPDKDLIKNIHQRTCECNCKMDALLAAAAGAAAGHMIGNKMDGKSMTAGLAGPVDEWTAGPFFASVLNKEGADYLGLEGISRSRPEGEIQDKASEEELRAEYEAFVRSIRLETSREFLCCGDDDEQNGDVVLFRALPNPQEDEASAARAEPRETAVSLGAFFDSEEKKILVAA